MDNLKAHHLRQKTYLLVHGAWHASWCWRKVAPILSDAGYNVLSINLPGHGQGEATFYKINLKTYIDYLIEAIKRFQTPITLVGHSFAGVILSQVAELIPDHIEQLIYVSAFIPESGQSLTTEAASFQSPGLTTELLHDIANNAVDLRRSPKLTELLFHLCHDEDIQFAMMNLQKEPLRPMLDSIMLSEKNFGQVKKTYIECLQDRTILIADQRRMHTRHSCQIMRLQADHSPFFSAPNELVAAILSA